MFAYNKNYELKSCINFSDIVIEETDSDPEFLNNMTTHMIKERC